MFFVLASLLQIISQTIRTVIILICIINKLKQIEIHIKNSLTLNSDYNKF